MTTSQPLPPIVPDGKAGETDINERETVGASDAAADAVRAGADVEPTRVERDSDGVPVGRDDLRADVERSGGDPDAA